MRDRAFLPDRPTMLKHTRRKMFPHGRKALGLHACLANAMTPKKFAKHERRRVKAGSQVFNPGGGTQKRPLCETFLK